MAYKHNSPINHASCHFGVLLAGIQRLGNRSRLKTCRNNAMKICFSLCLLLSFHMDVIAATPLAKPSCNPLVKINSKQTMATNMPKKPAWKGYGKRPKWSASTFHTFLKMSTLWTMFFYKNSDMTSSS